jgi:hypothetical protein
MATENNKNIKYPTKFHVRQQCNKVTDSDKKNTIKSIIEGFLTAVKIKHS